MTLLSGFRGAKRRKSQIYKCDWFKLPNKEGVDETKQILLDKNGVAVLDDEYFKKGMDPMLIDMKLFAPSSVGNQEEQNNSTNTAIRVILSFL